MSNIKFELNREGVAELLKGAEMQKILTDYAEKIRQNCTAGEVGAEEFEASTTVRGSRAVATVYPGTAHAYNSNLKHNTLIKAMGGIT